MKQRNRMDVIAALGGLITLGLVLSAINVYWVDDSESVVSAASQMRPLIISEVRTPLSDTATADHFRGATKMMPLTDEYARRNGFRDWNDYVQRRPATKTGERATTETEDIAEAQRLNAMAMADIERNERPLIDESEVRDIASQLDHERIADHYAHPRHPIVIERPIPAGWSRDDRPAVAVSEPSPLLLIFSGLVALLAKLNIDKRRP